MTEDKTKGKKDSKLIKMININEDGTEEIVFLKESKLLSYAVVVLFTITYVFTWLMMPTIINSFIFFFNISTLLGVITLLLSLIFLIPLIIFIFSPLIYILYKLRNKERK